jgi:hypothetical protein
VAGPKDRDKSVSASIFFFKKMFSTPLGWFYLLFTFHRELQRQHCKNLQRHECVWEIRISSSALKNALAFSNAGVVVVN